MPEKRGPERQETSLIPRSFDELKQKLLTAKAYLEETRATGKELLKDEKIREGGEAALRSVINVAISCVDIIPVAGEIASWSADIAAVIEESRYQERRKEAEVRGEDPRKVKREKYNLTPDVHILVKTITEVLEFIPIPLPFVMPTHAVETVGQLYYDIPRMHLGLKKARENLKRIREEREKARTAARVFRPQDLYKNIYGDDDKN